MANWNSTFTQAINPAIEQLGTLTTTTTPTLLRATQEWERMGPIVSVKMRAAGLSGTKSDWSDDGLEYFRQAEALLTSGAVLAQKGTVIKIGSSPDDATGSAAMLWALGMGMLEREELRILARGLVLFTGVYLAGDPRIASDWTRNKDPDYDDTPGTGDRPYAREPWARDQNADVDPL